MSTFTVPAAPRKRHLNWGLVQWYAVVPGNPETLAAPVTIVGVQDLQFDQGGKLLKGSGDNDAGPSTIVREYSEPMAAIKVDSIAVLIASGLKTGDRGILTAVQLDSQNGATAGGGALLHTLNPCVLEVGPAHGAYRKFADTSAVFNGYFPDGSTNPYTVVAIPSS